MGLPIPILLWPHVGSGPQYHSTTQIELGMHEGRSSITCRSQCWATQLYQGGYRHSLTGHDTSMSSQMLCSWSSNNPKGDNETHRHVSACFKMGKLLCPPCLDFHPGSGALYAVALQSSFPAPFTDSVTFLWLSFLYPQLCHHCRASWRPNSSWRVCWLYVLGFNFFLSHDSHKGIAHSKCPKTH